MILELLIVFLIGILVFTLQIYIGKKVALAVLFVNEEFKSDYVIIDGEGHLETVRELEREAEQ
ncbi:hypothetical protein U0355_09480 [Salimicrobium sp. PL1-032A]|uniref:hypothetical protein n=1 Tax=Salimicrobium sp. PL1-032A TaxID=3095364 RepID=UPI0032612465